MKRAANETHQKSRDARDTKATDPKERKKADALEDQAPGKDTDTASDAPQPVSENTETDSTGSAEVAAVEGASPDTVMTPSEGNTFSDQAGDHPDEVVEEHLAVSQNPNASSQGAEEIAPGSMVKTPGDRAVPDAMGKQMSAKPAPEPVSPAAGQAVPPDDQSTQPGENVLVEGEASDTEEPSLPVSRTGVLDDPKGRGSISTTLEAHRETLRQQRPLTGAAEARESSKTARDPQAGTTGKGDDASIRLPGMPPASTAQQPVAAPAVAEAQARPDRSDAAAQTPSVSQASGAAFDVRTQSTNVQVRPALTGGASASGAATQSAATGTVLQSTSAVVTSVFGTSDSAMTGEDVLTQRGAESFALPQLLAEASVRSGASSFRAETPRHVAQQLAEAVATNGKRNIDVSLNPRELGHVNMRVSTSETGVMVVIQAERQETEDLMRRHIQDLAREFKEMGFSDISFQFGSDTEAGQSGDGELADESGGAGLKGEGDAAEGEPQGLPLSQQLNISANGLDIRI